MSKINIKIFIEILILNFVKKLFLKKRFRNFY